MGFYFPPQSVPIGALGGVTVGAAEPSGPQDGHLWIDLGTGQVKVWHLGEWRLTARETPTADRYAIATSSLPGFTQAAGVTTELFGSIVSTLPGLTQASTP